MQLDSVMICATTEGELKRLLKHGGEIWQQVGKREQGKLRLQHTLVRLPYTAALELGLLLPGPKLKAAKASAA